MKLPFKPTYNDLVTEVKRLRKLVLHIPCYDCFGEKVIKIARCCGWRADKCNCKLTGEDEGTYDQKCGSCHGTGLHNGYVKEAIKDTIWVL